MCLDAFRRKRGELRGGGREISPVDLVVRFFGSCFGRRAFGGFIGRPVARFTAKHPPAEPHHSERGDEEGDAHAKPGRHPLAGEKHHASNYRETGNLGTVRDSGRGKGSMR
jgi:hypothetical protein